MFLRLVSDFSKDNRAGITIMTVMLMPLFMFVIYFAYDMGRYFMTTRFVASAAQQTVEWIAYRGTFAGEDPNAIAKQGFDARMGSNLTNGTIASTVLTFTHDPATRVNRLVVKASYNLALRKVLGLSPYPVAAVATVKLKPVFVSIVFSSGEMRSEGDYIYGNRINGNKANPISISTTAKLGVSWSNADYYNDKVIGQSVATRTTPTHNFYMTTALVKELTQRFQYRPLYMNIIPVSATINLNPLSASANPKGSNEGKLPPWIYNEVDKVPGIEIDKTSNADPTRAYCITNRSFPSGVGTGSWYRDYYEVHGSEITGTTIPVAGRYFTHDSLLMDSTIHHSVGEGVSVNSNPNALKTRGYPYSPLDSTGKCPAINSTPALATFQQVTTAGYTADATNVANPTENQIFWDYMRHFIDPALVTDYAIWGSPNMAFGLQIAYENIGYVQSTGKINNKNITDNPYDPTSDFLVYVVSDQIGAVKNAAGAYVTSSASGINNGTNRWPNYPSCVGIQDATATNNRCVFSTLNNSAGVPVRQLPSNDTAGATSVPFQFSHYWWDNQFNLSNPACTESEIISTDTCDIIYSSASNKVVNHFYNIINFSINLKYNKTLTKNLPKPKAFFIDTGSGKQSDTCMYSNTNNIFYFFDLSLLRINSFWPKHYQDPKYCFAYANMMGNEYQLESVTNEIVTVGRQILIKEGGINALSLDSLKFVGNDLWVTNPTYSISGFSGIIAKKVAAYNYNDYVDTYFPMRYYTTPKLRTLSNNGASGIETPETTANNTINAAAIAKFAVNASILAQPIVSPY